jgi:acid phosphatase
MTSIKRAINKKFNNDFFIMIHMRRRCQSILTLVVIFSAVFLICLVFLTKPETMRWSWSMAILAPAGLAEETLDLGWYPPKSTSINNLTTALYGVGGGGGRGVYGFIFNSSHTPAGQYGTYNWCNMPHVRKTEYVKAPAEYELEYVEVVSFAKA